MAQADADEIPFIDKEQADKLKHMIIWLDKHIGKSKECVILKSSFFMATSPITDLYEKSLNENDVDRSICNEKAFVVQLDKVKFMFQAFDDPGKCYETIAKNRHKRIFLITSGSKGELIVPRLVSNFPETFVPGYSIYIFCAKMNMIKTVGAGDPTNEWAFDYIDHISMHNHQDDLLTRLVLDIATYFFEEGERLEKSGKLDDALKYYEWSKLMWERYDTMEKTRNPMKGKINEMAERINKIEQQLREQEK
jgi:hypothetical protein